MRTQTSIMLGLSVAFLAVSGCGGDHAASSANQPPATPPTTEFGVYAESLVTRYSCETNPPAETNSIEFSFDLGQDTALPESTDSLAPSCST